MISSSRPRQNPWGELNWPLPGPSWPNLQRICIELRDLQWEGLVSKGGMQISQTQESGGKSPWLSTARLWEKSSHIDPRPQDGLAWPRDGADRLTAEAKTRHQIVQGREGRGAWACHARHRETKWKRGYRRVARRDHRGGEQGGRDQGKVARGHGVAPQVGKWPGQVFSVPLQGKKQVGIWRRPPSSAHALPLHLFELPNTGLGVRRSRRTQRWEVVGRLQTNTVS